MLNQQHSLLLRLRPGEPNIDRESLNPMPETETVHDLRKAPLELTRQRAELAKVLAGPFEQQKTTQAAQAFEQIQKTIEAIDAAIPDEVLRSTCPLGSPLSEDR